MQQSGTIGALSKSLVAAQAEIGHAVKENTNPAFRSKYADITSVINAIRPVYAQHGLALLQSIEEAGKPDHICIVTRLVHESGEWLESSLCIPLPQGKGAQGLGMSATYGRRYGAAAMCFLGQEDDDGNDASGVGAKTQAKPMSQPAPAVPVNTAPTPQTAKPADTSTPVVAAAPAAEKRGPGRPKKTATVPDADAVASLKASFEAVKTKEDIQKLIPLFTQLTPEQQQAILPTATAARERAGL